MLLRSRSSGPVPLEHSLPRPGTWVIDPSRTTVTFTGRANRLAPPVRGRFGRVSGAVHMADDPGQARVEVTIDLTSMTCGRPSWDQMLRKVDPFGASRFPTADFRSTAVDWDGETADVLGVLTLHGLTDRLSLDVTYHAGPHDDAAVVRANGVIDRTRWKVTCDVPGSSYFLPREMALAIEALVTYQR